MKLQTKYTIISNQKGKSRAIISNQIRCFSLEENTELSAVEFRRKSLTSNLSGITGPRFLGLQLEQSTSGHVESTLCYLRLAATNHLDLIWEGDVNFQVVHDQKDCLYLVRAQILAYLFDVKVIAVYPGEQSTTKSGPAPVLDLMSKMR